jgi:hypothetical protein
MQSSALKCTRRLLRTNSKRDSLASGRYRNARFAAATAARHQILVLAVDGAGTRSSFLLPAIVEPTA